MMGTRGRRGLVWATSRDPEAERSNDPEGVSPNQEPEQGPWDVVLGPET